MILVTGANGFVGSHLCAELAGRGVPVRALVRRPGTAPQDAGIQDVVGQFDDPATATEVVEGVDAVVTTVAQLGADRATHRRVTVDGTLTLAAAARDAGVARLVHVSTVSVYDLGPGDRDLDEDSPYVDDDAGDYPVTKRDAELALAELEGMTRILARPPAILGPSPRSMWNSLWPSALAADPTSMTSHPDETYAWVHVTDFARLLADMAAPASHSVAGHRSADTLRGPAEGEVTAVNVGAPDVTWGDYHGAVADAVGVTPTWSDVSAWTGGPPWTGEFVSARARSWGWEPTVTFDQAMQELMDGFHPSAVPDHLRWW